MKLLWHSNAPWAASGYGTTTKHTIRALRTAGHDPAVSAFWGLQGGILEWEGFQIYPAGLAPYGTDIVAAHASHFHGGPGTIVSLIDLWVLSDAIHTIKEEGHTWAAWLMVDQDPLIRDIANVAQHVDFLVVPSHHGVATMAAAGFDATYVPLPTDLSVYRPQPRAESRAAIGLPEDAFVFGMVAANKCPLGRKAFAQVIEAFAHFLRRHPDSDAYLYLHTEAMPAHGGWNVAHMCEVLGVPQGRAIVADRYMNHVGFPDDHMAKVFSAIDYLVSPSLGEGFGVPIVEAQACGTPVIAGAWTAMGELVGDGGILIDPADSLRWMTPQGGFWHIPQPGAVLGAMEEAYRRTAPDAAVVREAALPYDAPVVVRDHWIPLLDRIHEGTRARALPEPTITYIEKEAVTS